MKLQYLGTAAYEGIPAIFCDCDTCREARRLGGRNIRSRSQALINDELLIDFPADSLWHMNRYGLELYRIQSLLITHDHSDHLYPEDLAARGIGYGFLPEEPEKYPPLTVYQPAAAYRHTVDTAEKGAPGILNNRLACVEITPFVPFTTLGYTVTPLAANHSPASTPVIYAIERDGKRLLYAHDTGYFFKETWQALSAMEPFDLVSLDCTSILVKGVRNGHMNLETAYEVIERMKNEHLITEKTKIVLNHFSHNGGMNYDALQKTVEKDGILVSYDGMTLEF